MLCRWDDLTTYSLLLFSPLVINGEFGSFSWQIKRKFVTRGRCFEYQQSASVFLSSIKSVHAMFRTRKNLTLMIMFSVKNLDFACTSSATPSALCSDLLDVKAWMTNFSRSGFSVNLNNQVVFNRLQILMGRPSLTGKKYKYKNT